MSTGEPNLCLSLTDKGAYFPLVPCVILLCNKISINNRSIMLFRCFQLTTFLQPLVPDAQFMLFPANSSGSHGFAPLFSFRKQYPRVFSKDQNLQVGWRQFWQRRWQSWVLLSLWLWGTLRSLVSVFVAQYTVLSKKQSEKYLH